MVKKHLKLGQSYNVVLADVFPAMSVITKQQYDPLHLFLLFPIDFMRHKYGFILNDKLDNKIDKF